MDFLSYRLCEQNPITFHDALTMYAQITQQQSCLLVCQKAIFMASFQQVVHSPCQVTYKKVIRVGPVTEE